MNTVDNDALHSAIAALNAAGLTEEILTDGKSKEELLKAFIIEIDRIPDTDTVAVPAEVKEFYRNIPDHLFTDDDFSEEFGNETPLPAGSTASNGEPSGPLQTGTQASGDEYDDTIVGMDPPGLLETGDSTANVSETPTALPKKKKSAAGSPPQTSLQTPPPVETSGSPTPSAASPKKKKSAPPQEAGIPQEAKIPKGAAVTSTSVGGSEFLSFLKKISLKKTNNECVISIMGGYALCMCYDENKTVFAKVAMPCAGTFGLLGIGKLDLLIKYFEAHKKQDVTISMTGNRLRLSAGGAASLSYRLSDESMIPTYSEEYQVYGDTQEIVKEYSHVADLTEAAVAEALAYLKITSAEECTFSVSAEGKMVLRGGSENAHGFEVIINEALARTPEAGSNLPNVLIHGRVLSHLLSLLDFTEDCRVYVSLKESVVVENGDTAWVLAEIEDEGK